MALSLYHISQEHMDLHRQIEACADELTPELEEALLLNEQDFEEKAISYGFLIKRLRDDAKIAKAEKERVAAIEKRYNTQADRLEFNLLNAMHTFGFNDGIKTPLLKLSIMKSKALIVTDETLVPVDYKTTETVIKTIVDNKRLKADLIDGAELEGAYIEVRDNLQIK